MKYSIHIDQRAIFEAKLDLDFNDAAILDFIVGFSIAPHVSKFLEPDNKLFFWLSHQLIIDELPMLGIKTESGIYRRLTRYIELGLLEAHPQSQKMGKSYYYITPLLHKINYGKLSADKHNSETPHSTNSQNPFCQPAELLSASQQNPLLPPSRTPSANSQNNYSISDYSNKNNSSNKNYSNHYSSTSSFEAVANFENEKKQKQDTDVTILKEEKRKLSEFIIMNLVEIGELLERYIPELNEMYQREEFDYEGEDVAKEYLLGLMDDIRKKKGIEKPGGLLYTSIIRKEGWRKFTSDYKARKNRKEAEAKKVAERAALKEQIKDAATIAYPNGYIVQYYNLYKKSKDFAGLFEDELTFAFWYLKEQNVEHSYRIAWDKEGKLCYEQIGGAK